jgi:phospholipase C
VAASLDGFLGDIPLVTKTRPAGAGWGCDSNRITGWLNPSTSRVQFVPSCIPDYTLGLPHGGAFRDTPVPYVPTIMDRLDAAGLSWRFYGGTSTQQGYIWSTCPTFAECLNTSQDGNLVTEPQAITDAQRGRLPAFSVITPGGSDYTASCHNGFSMTACDNFVGQVASAIMNGPQWSSTVLFITWDDCGCFYDQVRPGVNPDGTSQGPRVPLLIVSPYAKAGFTDRSTATFTSILAFVEHTFGLAPMGVNDAQAYDFSGALNLAQAPHRPVRMVTRPLPPWAKRMRLTPALLNDPS